jgi:hypothetical protein
MNKCPDNCPHRSKPRVNHSLREITHECLRCESIETSTLGVVHSTAEPADLWLLVNAGDMAA